jgi:hypothetical protein
MPETSGSLPQEAVDAAAEAIDMRTIHLTADPQLVQFHPVVWAEAALTAALPFLRQQWEAETEDLRVDRARLHSRLGDANSLLAAERAKVAALREAIIRECIDWMVSQPIGAGYLADRMRVALLPAVSEGASTPGPTGSGETFSPPASIREIVRHNTATVEQPNGTAGECGHTVLDRTLRSMNVRPAVLAALEATMAELHPDGRCPSQSDKGEQ